jgi:hypothetical protein
MDECQVAGKLIVGNRARIPRRKLNRITGWPPSEWDRCEISQAAPLGMIYIVGTLIAATMLMAALAVVVRGAKARL